MNPYVMMACQGNGDNWPLCLDRAGGCGEREGERVWKRESYEGEEKKESWKEIKAVMEWERRKGGYRKKVARERRRER